jgi:poly-gamma-glutamate synthesis protein (capsule biosynthesis protein)
MKISFIGDVMLGRFVAGRYRKDKYQVLSKEVVDYLNKADYVVGNLESPVSEEIKDGGDHLAFKGEPDLLKQFSFVDCFSLSNNHINDFGQQGMEDSILWLNKFQIPWNGLYKENYEPHIFENDGVKCALFTCTDMMNIPFDSSNPWKTYKIDSPELDNGIKEYSGKGYVVILYAHVGMLFTRYPNPPIRTLLQEKVDIGVDAIVTVHSHCLGGMEYYKGKPIFHSIGDFVMDGNSFRRRQSAILDLDIKGKDLIEYTIKTAQINYDYETVFPKKKVEKGMHKSWDRVSSNLEKHTKNYPLYFKQQYKWEIFNHIRSTLNFLLRSKGVKGALQLIVKRLDEVKKVKNWIKSDRSGKRFDDDVIEKDRKKFSQKELFGID